MLVVALIKNSVCKLLRPGRERLLKVGPSKNNLQKDDVDRRVLMADGQ